MTNNQNQIDKNTLNDSERETEEFDPTEEAQKLGGGKGAGGGTEIGNFGDDDFNKTDQSISQVVPGKVSSFENQGGSE